MVQTPPKIGWVGAGRRPCVVGSAAWSPLAGWLGEGNVGLLGVTRNKMQRTLNVVPTCCDMIVMFARLFQSRQDLKCGISKGSDTTCIRTQYTS